MQSGTTPLHRAAFKGHEAVIKVLVAAKANVHARDNVRGGCWEGEGGDGVGSAF